MMAMTTLALVLGATGAATSAYGSFRAGGAARRAGEAQQRAADKSGELADFNAQVAELQADDAITRGQEEEQRFRARVRGTIGSQRAGFAASNIDVNFGSAVDVQADAARLGELDALTIRGNAAREAWGFKMQAEDLHRRGDLAREEGVAYNDAGQANQSAARWGAASSLITSGSSLLAARYGFGRT